MNFKEINTLDDIYSFFDERGIQPTPEDITLLKIDARHFLRLVVEENLDRTIANNFKKEYLGKEEFVEHLLIIRSDFELFILKKLYGDPDTVVYDKKKRYASDTEQSLLKKINSLKYEDTDTNDSIYDLFDIREIVDKFYEEYQQLKKKLSESIKGTLDSEFLAQIILDRIIFIYFLQAKNIIPPNYLASLYFSMGDKENFYTDYLHPIFFEPFNTEKKDRDSELEKRFAKFPFLNGGLFSMVEGIESKGGDVLKIEISNEYWKELFILLNSYAWIIEEDRGDSVSITPSVLGHIYEKSVSQKETGSYYTSRIITDHIITNTIYPYLTEQLNDKFKTNYIHINILLDRVEHSNEEQEQIAYLYFTFLKKISICDPACGSGAFLIAIEYALLNIYEKCISILRGSSYFEEEEETIKNFDSEKYYIKREIITKNIYGIDIQEGCVEIAKLRLWLSMVSEIESAAEEIEPLPNIDYNIMVGNSLVGFTRLPKKKKTIDDFLGKNISKIEELQRKKDEYRRERSSKKVKEIRNLIQEDIKDIRNELDLILAKQNDIEIGLEPIKVEDFINNDNFIENIKEKIVIINKENELTKFKIVCKINNKIDANTIRSNDGITCHQNRKAGEVTSIYPTSSFNSKKYKENGLRPLSDLIISLFDNWNYIKQIEFTKKTSVIDIKELKAFHWVVEFYDIFSKGGFDIIVGNPPHGDLLNDLEKKRIKLLYNHSDPNNIAEVFLERSFSQLRLNGRLGYVIPKTIGFYSAWSKIRNYILNNHSFESLSDLGIAFVGVNFEQLALVVKKLSKNNLSLISDNKVRIYIVEPLKNPKYIKKIELLGNASQSLMKIHNIFIFRPITDVENDIIKTIDEASIKFRNIYEKAFRGLYIPDKEKEKFRKGPIKWINKVPDVKRYFINKIMEIRLEKKWEIKSSEILKPRLFFKVLRGNRLVCYIDRKGELLTTEKLVNIELKDDTEYNLETLMLIINSYIPSFYIEKLIFSGTTETSRVMDDPYVGEIPIPKLLVNQELFKIMCDFLLFLNYSEEKRNSEKDLIEFIDKQLIDSLVYELYLKKELKTNLIKLVDTNMKKFELKDVDYDLITIKRIIEDIQNNDQIIKEIEEIKNNKWVRLIERRNNDSE